MMYTWLLTTAKSHPGFTVIDKDIETAVVSSKCLEEN